MSLASGSYSVEEIAINETGLPETEGTGFLQREIKTERGLHVTPD